MTSNNILSEGGTTYCLKVAQPSWRSTVTVQELIEFIVNGLKYDLMQIIAVQVFVFNM